MFKSKTHHIAYNQAIKYLRKAKQAKYASDAALNQQLVAYHLQIAEMSREQFQQTIDSPPDAIQCNSCKKYFKNQQAFWGHKKGCKQ